VPDVQQGVTASLTRECAIDPRNICKTYRVTAHTDVIANGQVASPNDAAFGAAERARQRESLDIQYHRVAAHLNVAANVANVERRIVLHHVDCCDNEPLPRGVRMRDSRVSQARVQVAPAPAPHIAVGRQANVLVLDAEWKPNL